MSKEEKMLAVCNAIAHYIHTNEHKKAFYLLEKFIEPATDRIAQLESELQMLHDYLIKQS